MAVIDRYVVISDRCTDYNIALMIAEGAEVCVVEIGKGEPPGPMYSKISCKPWLLVILNNNYYYGLTRAETKSHESPFFVIIIILFNTNNNDHHLFTPHMTSSNTSPESLVCIHRPSSTLLSLSPRAIPLPVSSAPQSMTILDPLMINL